MGSGGALPRMEFATAGGPKPGNLAVGGAPRIELVDGYRGWE